MINEKDFKEAIEKADKREIGGYCYELAKKMAIEFAKHLNKEGYCPGTDGEGDWIKLGESDETLSDFITTEELFNLYTTETNNETP